MHAVEGAANAGQIVVSATTAGSLPARNLGAAKGPGRLLRGDLLPLEESQQAVFETTHDLTRYVPTALREPIARGAVVSEHRPAANAFIRFSGVDALLAKNVDATTDALEELIDDIQSAIDPRQIALLNTDVYPDGLKIHLSAGAPVTTGEDEENLLLAVREIVDKKRVLPLHVGVTRGPVFAGDVGTMFRRGYTVMGDQVNLAARLMSRAAPHQILVTEAVLRGSRTLFETEELEPFAVKGKAKPVVAYELGSPRGIRSDASGLDAPFVGRNEEMRSLSGSWEQVRDGSGCVLLIGGATGAGKSRLVAEFVETLDDCSLHRVVCRRYRQSTPYFAATLLLGEVLGIDRFQAEGRADRLRSVVDQVAPDLLPWLSLIGTALGIEVAESDEVALLAPEFRKARLEESVVRLLGAVLTEPTLLWLDDAQWLDGASGDLLSTIAATISDQRWMLCISGRVQDQDEVFKGADAVRMTLGPLSDDDALRVVQRCTDDAPLASHVAAAIVDRAAGNPMFLNQLIATAMSSRDADALPESIEGVVTARIDQLLPDDRNVLRQLSVLGTGFRPEFAAVVLDEPASPALFKRLGQFLDATPEWVQFHSSLVHHAAYGGLPYRQRRDLHGRVAESIERKQGGAALLSVHFSAAGRWAEAWRYSRQAGDLSRESYANLEAAGFYEKALEAARYVSEATTTQRIAVLTALGEARYAAGLYDAAGSAFRRARRLAEEPLTVAGLCLEEAKVAHKRGSFSQALRWTTKGRRVLEGANTKAAQALRADLSVWAGGMRYSQGRYRQAVEIYEQAIEEARLAGNQSALAHAYYLHDAARVWAGQPGTNEFSWRALAIYEDMGVLTEQAVVVGNLATFAYLDGRWTDAVELYERSRQIHLKSGNPVEAARAEENLGELLCDRGDLDQAETVLASALRTWKAAENPAECAFVQCQLGRVASRDGRYEEAAALLGEAEQGFAEIGARYDALDVRTRIVENMVFQGKGSEAVAQIERASREAGEFGEGLHLTRMELMLGYALSQADRPAEGLDEVEQALAIARERDALYEVALGLEARTRLRAVLGVAGWDEGLEETWAIQDTLGIVSIPRVPLQSRAG